MPTTDAAADEALKKLLRTGTQMEFRKGEVIIRGDDESAPYIYYVEKGFVKTYAVNNRGEEYIRIIYSAGDFFSVTSLMTGSPRHIYYESLEETTAYRFNRLQLLDAARNDLSIAYGLLRLVLRQFVLFSNRVDNLEYKYASERVVYRLLLLASRFGVPQADGSLMVDAPISQQTLANTINVSREGVSRELDRLRQKGLITYNHRRVIITDHDGLKRELGKTFDL